MRNPLSPPGRSALAAGLLLAAAACAGDVTAPAAAPPDALGSRDAPGAAFNPQPEPPARVLSFVAAGDLRRMTGRVTGDGGGELAITGLASRQRGQVLHVVQRWEIHPPEPVAPTSLLLTGILNRANGRFVLRGTTAGGAQVHVAGEARLSADGGVSMGGELMFNPQPEPPAR